MKAKLEDFKGEPNKTYRQTKKEIEMTKQNKKISQIISMEAKLKIFKGEQNKTYRKTKKYYEQSIYTN